MFTLWLSPKSHLEKNLSLSLCLKEGRRCVMERALPSPILSRPSGCCTDDKRIALAPLRPVLSHFYSGGNELGGFLAARIYENIIKPRVWVNRREHASMVLICSSPMYLNVAYMMLTQVNITAAALNIVDRPTLLSYLRYPTSGVQCL